MPFDSVIEYSIVEDNGTSSLSFDIYTTTTDKYYSGTHKYWTVYFTADDASAQHEAYPRAELNCVKRELSQSNQESIIAENESNAEPSQTAPSVTFVPWSEAGIEDHGIDWQDEGLEATMRWITGIYDRDVMLSDVWELTSLDLQGKRISNISALSNLTNLTELSLVVNQISDISALSGLTNLTELSLYDNQINDISALSGLVNLRYLQLAGNLITDYSPVEFVEQNSGTLVR